MKVVILGGAGFIGSNLARRFVEEDAEVVVIDGFVDGTGGRRENLATVRDRIQLVESLIEDLDRPEKIFDDSDLVIDAMAWTSHLSADRDPFKDLRLNLESHLHLAEILKHGGPVRRLVYLGSRGQYGRPAVPVITEETPMTPVDLQGIHKTAGEAYGRLLAARGACAVASLRIANCFGPGQMTTGEDVGLVGNFVRDLLASRALEVFGDGRRRNLVYVEDVSTAVLAVAKSDWRDFEAFNLGGFEIEVEDLARRLVALHGSGTVVRKEIPEEIRRLDGGEACFSSEKIRRLVDGLPTTPIDEALARTLAYFREGRS